MPDNQQLQEAIQHLQNENAQILAENERIRVESTQAYERAFEQGSRAAQEQGQHLLTSQMCRGIEGIKNELRMQSCSTHIRTFEGQGQTADDFLNWVADMEKNLTQLHNDDGNAMRSLVTQTVSGPAADLVTRLFRANPDLTWIELREAMDERYNDAADETLAKQRLRKLEQNRKEDVQGYYERLMKLAQRVYKDRLDDPLIQSTLVDIFMDGVLDDQLAKKLIKIKPQTLEEALAGATTEQQAKRAFDIRRKITSKNRGMRPGEEDMEIGTLRSAPSQDKTAKEIQQLRHLIQNCLLTSPQNGTENTVAEINSHEIEQLPQQLFATNTDCSVNYPNDLLPSQQPMVNVFNTLPSDSRTYIPNEMAAVKFDKAWQAQPHFMPPNQMQMPYSQSAHLSKPNNSRLYRGNQLYSNSVSSQPRSQFNNGVQRVNQIVKENRTCHYCGIPGHIRPNCWKKAAAERAQLTQPKLNQTAITCYACGGAGHMKNECPSISVNNQQKMKGAQQTLRAPYLNKIVSNNSNGTKTASILKSPRTQVNHRSQFTKNE